MARVSIIGAGLAGLSAALECSRNGQAVTLYEATQRAGGRCRSFHDETLGCVIDNGNHLVMGGNKATLAFLDEIGARDRLVGKAPARFPFVDVRTGERWTLRPNRGLIPWWVFKRDRRIPDTTPLSYRSALGLLSAGGKSAVGDAVTAGDTTYERMWEPLTVAALNTDPADAAAALMKPVLLKTFGRGEAGCRPMIARDSLADTFVDPAVATLKSRDVDIRFGARLRAMETEDGRITELGFGDHGVMVGPGDQVIMAVPAWDVGGLISGITAPAPGEPIVNVHFRLPEAPEGFDEVDLLGVIGGFAQWIFVRGPLVSITISAAAEQAGMEAEEIAERGWADVQVALGVASACPPYRVIKERRATFQQTPDALDHRSGPGSDYPNLFLAGDWTDTGLPATIEGAIVSGRNAARAANKALRKAA